MKLLFIVGLVAMLCAGTLFNASCNEIPEEEIIMIQGQVVKSESPSQPAQSNLQQSRKKRDAHPFQQIPSNLEKAIKLNVCARSYCLRGFTSRGAATSMGVIAVDPSIIPYGSRIYIPGFGWGTALDTGGAIRGNSIDIWMPTYGQCMQWGVRNVTVTVIKP